MINSDDTRWGKIAFNSSRNPRLTICYEKNCTTIRNDGKKSREEVQAVLVPPAFNKDLLHACLGAHVRDDKIIFSYFTFGKGTAFSEQDVEETMKSTLELLQADGKEIVVDHCLINSDIKKLTEFQSILGYVENFKQKIGYAVTLTQ